MSQFWARKSTRAAFGGTTILGLAALVVLGSAGGAMAATPAPIGLGHADSFDILAGTTVTNALSTVVHDGDVGVSPGSAITGFPPGIIVNGVKHSADQQALQGKADASTAYTNAAGRTPDQSGLTDLSGLTLTSGVYSGGALSLTGTLTLSGDSSSVFIFQAASTLITASSSVVQFTGGANECNVFWQVGSSATLGTNSTFVGTILAHTSISANTGAHIRGRLLAGIGAVTLQDNTITRSAACATRSAIQTSSPTAAQQAAAKAAAKAAAARAAAAAALAKRSLAPTGVDVAPALTLGTVLMITGAFLLLVQRRRRNAPRT